MQNTDIPEGWNRFPTQCRLCGEFLEAGAGPMRRIEGLASRSAYWLIEHPDCPGIRPWRQQKSGWVYICTGVGPDSALIKVGSTAGSPSDRVTELFGYYFPCFVSLRETVRVWGAHDADNRYKAETRVLKALHGYLAPNDLELGKEVFTAPLPLALRVLESEVSGVFEFFPWASPEGRYRPPTPIRP